MSGLSQVIILYSYETKYDLNILNVIICYFPEDYLIIFLKIVEGKFMFNLALNTKNLMKQSSNIVF